MKKTIGRVATIIILAMCALILWRCFLVADKSTFSKPIATDALKAAYSDGESVVYTVDIAAELADDGYFSAYAFYYNPESGEVQVAVRWNNSVYTYTDMEEGHEFTFYLENETTGETYPATAVESDTAHMYNYRRLVANGVKLGNEEKLNIVMELRDGYTTQMVIKHAEQPLETYKLKNKLQKELLK